MNKSDSIYVESQEDWESIVNAVNSYRKHCINPHDAAKQDLVGQMIVSLSKLQLIVSTALSANFVKTGNPHDRFEAINAALLESSAILAQTKEADR